MTSANIGRSPRRREDGTACQALADGSAVVIDLQSGAAHGLDELAATVWRLADGSHGLSAIALSADVSEEIVVATLEQLSGLGLLTEFEPVGHSRRRVLLRGAQAGGGLLVAGAVINSMALPAAAAAVSNVQRYIGFSYDDSTGHYYFFNDAPGAPSEAGKTTYYLSPTALSAAAPSTPYVMVNLTTSQSAILTFSPGSSVGVEASYGISAGTDPPTSADNTSLVADQAQTVSVPTLPTTLYVIIGT